MSSAREAICDDILKTAQGMTLGQGYHFDWGSFFRHLAPDEPDDLPAFGQADVSETLTQEVYPLHFRTLTVQLRGYHFVPDPSEDNPGTIANRMIADIERAMMQDVTRGKNAVDTRIIANETFIGVPASNDVTVSVTAEIDYRTELRDPNRRA